MEPGSDRTLSSLGGGHRSASGFAVSFEPRAAASRPGRRGRNYVDDGLAGCRINGNRGRSSTECRPMTEIVPGGGARRRMGSPRPGAIRRRSRADGAGPRIDMCRWDVTSRGVASIIRGLRAGESYPRRERMSGQGAGKSARYGTRRRGARLSLVEPAGRPSRMRDRSGPAIELDGAGPARGLPSIGFCVGALFRLYSEWEEPPCRST
jgi:hypothetical protein